MTSQLGGRTHDYMIVNNFTSRSKKLLKVMPKTEKLKIFQAIEDFCVNGTQALSYHAKHYTHEGHAYLKPTSRSQYRVIITHEEGTEDCPDHYCGKVYLHLVIPRKDLETWLKQQSS